MRKERQLGFADFERSMTKKRTTRGQFLSMMEKVVPWEELEAMLKPVYGKQDKTVGRNPYPLPLMLRITAYSSDTHSVMREWKTS